MTDRHMNKVAEETGRHETQEDFTSLDKTWLDKSCGDGKLLERIVMRRVKAQPELTDEAILRIYMTTFGTDICDDNIRECRRRLFGLAVHELGYLGCPVVLSNILKHNIVCTDMFDWDYENWRPVAKPAENINPSDHA